MKQNFIKKTIICLFVLSFKMMFSQSNCPEIYFQSPNSSSSRMNLFPQPDALNTQNILNSDPDAAIYPDAFPNNQYVYNVIFKIIRNDNGIRTTGNIDEPEVMNAIRDINLNFNQFNVFFKYGGFEYIDHTNLTGNQLQSEFDTNFIAPYWTPHNFYIFVLDGDIVGTYSDGTTYQTPGLGYLIGNLTFVSTTGLTSTRILSHEIGHNFYLYHDFKFGGPDVGCEHVVRNTDSEFYNATVTSDRIHDTPATRIWDFSEYDSSGFYIGSNFDCSNNPILDEKLYKNGYPRYDNFMHWHAGADLASYHFTAGQGKRIRWALATDILQGQGYWSVAQIDVDKLYEPYKAIQMGGDAIVTVTDNNDGTAEVCRNLIRKDRFQKGFKCKFYNMDGSLFDQGTPDDLKSIDERTTDYKVEIFQVAPGVLKTISVVCTKGVVCSYEDFVGGIVLSTQVLGSMNITAQELNQIQVKDPNLYNHLMEQYYYILKKYTASGALYQKVFYKQ